MTMRTHLTSTPARRALLGLVLAVGLAIAPLSLVVVGFGELAWTTSWIFHFALAPSALIYAASQAIAALRA